MIISGDKGRTTKNGDIEEYAAGTGIQVRPDVRELRISADDGRR